MQVPEMKGCIMPIHLKCADHPISMMVANWQSFYFEGMWIICFWLVGSGFINVSFIDHFQAFQQQAQELVALETIVLQTLGECCSVLYDCVICAFFLCVKLHNWFLQSATIIALFSQNKYVEPSKIMQVPHRHVDTENTKFPFSQCG